MTHQRARAGQTARRSNFGAERVVQAIATWSAAAGSDRDATLVAVERLLAALGRPPDKLQGVVHVAGTNGKGSVIAFLKAMLEASGKRVHVFTSPHLVRFHERIALAGADGAEQISEATLSDYLLRVEAANGTEPITFFEITTAAAFLAFAENRADYVLLGAGLGGRLDATNVMSRPALTDPRQKR